MTQELRVAVVLASAGRPDLLAEALESVASQRGVEFETVVSVPDDASLPDRPDLLGLVTVVTGVRGASAQRNAGIAVLRDPQVVAFFDDDSVLRSDWLAQAHAFFTSHPGVVGLTGRVLVDGAVTGEISHEQTNRAIADSWLIPATGRWEDWQELYGCNFAVRLDRIGDERFDERLALYSWLEDHDLARRLLRIGKLARVHDCVIVHRAAESGGRQNHLRLGYSQVMNPLYLWRKGSFPFWYAVRHLGRRVAKNALLSLALPARSDRRERLRGNLMAFGDATRGRFTPERITELR